MWLPHVFIFQAGEVYDGFRFFRRRPVDDVGQEGIFFAEVISEEQDEPARTVDESDPSLVIQRGFNVGNDRLFSKEP